MTTMTTTTTETLIARALAGDDDALADLRASIRVYDYDTGAVLAGVPADCLIRASIAERSGTGVVGAELREGVWYLSPGRRSVYLAD